MFQDLRGSAWARWRVAARLARRQAWRTRGSSLLIVLLIALPVAGLVTAATMTTSTIPTAEQFLDAELGHTQTRVEIVYGPDPSLAQAPVDSTWWRIDTDPDTTEPVHAPQEPITDVTPLLPAGTTTLRIQSASVFARTTAGIGSMAAIVGPAGDPAFAGRYDIVEGRAPGTGGEALVTRSALEDIGAKIGGDLELQNPTRTFTITGVVDIVDQPDATRTVVLPEAEESELVGVPVWYLPDTALTWEQIQQLNPHGVAALSRPVALNPPVTGTDLDEAQLVHPEATVGSILLVGGLIFAFVAYQIVLLAGAAFSVSARRQQRSLAMAASVGSAKKDLRRVVVMQGVVLSGVGALLGVGLGLGGAWAAMRLLDDGDRTRFWGFAPWPWLLVAIAALAVVVGTASALLPARSAAKVDVLSMLRGARRPQRMKRSRPVWGLVLLTAGVAVSAASVIGIVWGRSVVIPSDDIRAILPQIGIFVGPVIAQVGVIISGHWLLHVLERPLSRLGLAPRLAIRDAAANGTRSAAALGSIGAAVMLATFAVSALSITVGAQAHGYTYSSPPGTLVVEVSGEGTSVPTPERVDRAESVLDAQSPRATGVLRRNLDAYDVPEADRSSTEVATLVSPDEVVCAGDGADRRSDECERRLDALQGLYITTADSLPVVLGTQPDDKVLRTFRDGGAVVLDDSLLTDDGKVRIGFWNAHELFDRGGGSLIWPEATKGNGLAEGTAITQSQPARQQLLDTVTVTPPERFRYTALISEQTAADLGIATGSVTLIGAFDEPADDAMVESITAEAGLDAGLYVKAENGPPTPTVGILLMLAATGILMLGTSAIVLGLARIDGAADDATLAAVGATPGLRRRISFWQGLIIALLGSLTGAALGLLPVWGLMSTDSTASAADIPWWAIAAIAVGLPLVVATVNALTSRRHLTVTRRASIA